MGPERKEDIAHAKNFLTFGYGPHYCVGKEYAINQLTLFLAIVSLEADWTRTRTPDSGEAMRWGARMAAMIVGVAMFPPCLLHLHAPVGEASLLSRCVCSLCRRETPSSFSLPAEKMKYLPTIYPHDSLIAFRPRTAAA
jgi:hypothetical protein